MLRYEEWGGNLAELSDDTRAHGVAYAMYADWTADREELIRQRSSVSFELEMMDEYRKKDNQYLLNRAEAAEADAAYQRRHRKWALRRVRRWFYWRKRADDMGDAWLTQKSRGEAAEAERDKLAKRVRVLEEAILRHRGANDVITLVDKDLYAALEEEKR